jgi:hypothetical protein
LLFLPLGASFCLGRTSTPIAALAGSVTKADLAGKKICWSDGWATYGKMARSTRRDAAHGGTWSMAGDRVKVRGEQCQFDFSISKENGSFHALGYNNYEALGKCCN